MSDTQQSLPPENGPDANGASQEAGGPTAALSPQDRIAALENELRAAKEQHLRALAEVENVRRRAQREREDVSKFAISGFAKELLAVADNLRRAIDAVPAAARETDEMLKGLVAGVEATERQLFASFERFGVKRMEPQGQPFDPNFHQVVFEMDAPGQTSGTVAQVLQAGYTLHGRLLREAMVGVAKGGPEAARVNTTA